MSSAVTHRRHCAGVRKPFRYRSPERTPRGGNPLLQGFPRQIHQLLSSMLPLLSAGCEKVSHSAECDQRLCLWKPQAFEKA